VAGMVLSQWMHSMVFVMYDQSSGMPKQTALNVLYFYHVIWWIILGASIVLMTAGGLVMHRLIQQNRRIQFPRIILLVLGVIGMSQVIGSSIPKLSGEMSIGAFFIMGLLINRYFLTYGAKENEIPSHQLQSDALTSLGLLVSIIALWWPAALGFGEFLWNGYFRKETVMAQFQMTRYGAYVAWTIFGFSIVGWKIIEKLVEARSRVE
jgi:hypothetical protein